MKEEYDFAKGERGKFFRENSKLNLPIIWTARSRPHRGGRETARGTDAARRR